MEMKEIGKSCNSQPKYASDNRNTAFQPAPLISDGFFDGKHGQVGLQITYGIFWVVC